MAASQSGNLADKMVEVNGFHLICAKLDNVKPDAMRSLSDSMRDSDPLTIAVLASDDGVKGTLCVCCGKEAVALGAHAGNLARAAAQAAGGSGGGRPDSAMAGYKELDKSNACFDAAKAAVDNGMQKVEVVVKGPGPGRESAIRSLQVAHLQIISIQDVTPIPHNGCRPPKRPRG